MATALAFDELFVRPTQLQKCPHGIYLAGEKEKAAYCLGCYPAGLPFATKNVVLPRQSSDPLENRDLRANTNPEGSCQECGSRVYVELPKKMRECADCSTKYPAPRVRPR